MKKIACEKDCKKGYCAKIMDEAACADQQDFVRWKTGKAIAFCKINCSVITECRCAARKFEESGVWGGIKFSEGLSDREKRLARYKAKLAKSVEARS